MRHPRVPIIDYYSYISLPHYDHQTPPPHTQCPKSWGYVDFKMPTNENALTQPKFELGICGIIQYVFQGDYTTKPKIWKLLEKT